MKKFIVFAVAMVLLVSCTKAGETPPATSSPPVETSAVTATPQPTLEPTVEASNEVMAETSEEQVTLSHTATITGGSHNSSATVNLYSDNTIEVLSFNFDGRAPDVYIALGNYDNNGVFQRTLIVSPKLEGAFTDATLNYTIEEDVAFDAVSIWCEAYAEDFGSANFVDLQ